MQQQGSVERIKIGAPQSRVLMHLAIALPVAILGLLCLYGAGSVLIAADATGDERLIATVALLGIAALCARAVWVWIRQICFTGAFIETDGMMLRIHDPRRLDAPVETPLANVLVAAVDEPDRRESHHRLPVFAPAHGSGPGWNAPGVWNGEHAVGVLLCPDGYIGQPLLAGALDVNCAILFKTPLRIASHKPQGFGGRHSDFDITTGVLMFHAIDPRSFHALFARYGLLRRITTADADIATRSQPPLAAGVPAVAPGWGFSAPA